MNVAKRTQQPIIQLLKQYKINFTPFWITNIIAAFNVDKSLIYILAKRSDVKKIYSNEDIPQFIPEQLGFAQPQNVEWNVKWIGADQVWEAAKKKGEGVVVGGCDTGIEYDHEGGIFDEKTN